MEVQAVLEALRANDGPITIVSDSTYVVHCFRDRWWDGWIKRGWVNSQRKPVANRDLWEPFIELVRARDEVTFRWVKGHNGDPMNDLVDRLAVEAAADQAGRSGDGDPGPLGPIDRPRPTGASAPMISGHPLVVLGHRPPELGGYEENPVSIAVRERLVAIIEAKAIVEEDLVVVSGLRLGAEMLGAEAAVEVGVPLVVVLPYPDPDSVWPPASREQFRRLKAQAVDVVQLQRTRPSSTSAAGAALARRDSWLAQHSAEAVLVWDRRDAALAKLHDALEARLGDDVWVVDPAEVT
jgi:uncharacterized phage-like protein YoqJ